MEIWEYCGKFNEETKTFTFREDLEEITYTDVLKTSAKRAEHVIGNNVKIIKEGALSFRTNLKTVKFDAVQLDDLVKRCIPEIEKNWSWCLFRMYLLGDSGI